MKLFTSIVAIILIISQVILIFTVLKQKSQVVELIKMKDDYKSSSTQYINSNGFEADIHCVKLQSEMDLLSARVRVLEVTPATNKLEAEIIERNNQIKAIENDIIGE